MSQTKRVRDEYGGTHALGRSVPRARKNMIARTSHRLVDVIAAVTAPREAVMISRVKSKLSTVSATNVVGGRHAALRIDGSTSDGSSLCRNDIGALDEMVAVAVVLVRFRRGAWDRQYDDGGTSVSASPADDLGESRNDDGSPTLPPPPFMTILVPVRN
jgi:hypothetical protein